MQIFALETNVNQLKERLFSASEKEIFTVRRHGILFALRSCWYGFLTLLMVALSLYIILSGFQNEAMIVIGFFLVWFAVLFIPWLRAFIDWRYDFIFLTDEKLVIVDQTTITRRIITTLSLESIAQVNSRSQWLNLFGFGVVTIVQKEGFDDKFILPYLPNSDRLAFLISEQIAAFESRFDTPSPPRV